MVCRFVPLVLSLGLVSTLGLGLLGAGAAQAQDVKKAPATKAAEAPKQEPPKKEEAKPEPAKKEEAAKKEPEKPAEVPAPAIPKEVEEKLEKARHAVAEAIVAAQDAGLVDTSIDPPPILDILIKGYAFDGKILKDPAAKKTYWAVSPEVFCAWFTGYGKQPQGATINPQTDIRIINPSAGLKALFDQRANFLNKHIEEVRKAKGQTAAPKAAEAKKEEAKPAPKAAEPPKAEPKKEETKK